MHSTFRTVFAGSLAALTLTLTACSGGSSTPATTIPPGVDLVVKAVPTIRWDKADYVAPAGDVDIFLANDDNVKHVMVILKDDKVYGDLELIITKRGDTAQGTITLEPGQYRIYCTIPGHSSMNSSLTVS